PATRTTPTTTCRSTSSASRRSWRRNWSESQEEELTTESQRTQRRAEEAESEFLSCSLLVFSVSSVTLWLGTPSAQRLMVTLSSSGRYWPPSRTTLKCVSSIWSSSNFRRSTFST